MAEVRKRPVLDEIKKREIVAMVSVGCSRRVAAGYVGCSPSTIRRTAERDPDFAERLQRASYTAQIGYLKNIQKAAKKEQYWRAAAWALERLNPDDFSPRRPDTVTLAQIERLWPRIAQVILDELPDPKQRKNILKRLEALVADLRGSGQPPAAEEAS